MFKTQAANTQRKLGEPPNDSDLTSVVFKYGTNFAAGEIVLVPRSRGG